MPYYHVAIGTKNRSEHLSEMDLSEAQLREHIVKPYHAGEEFLCDGIAVNPLDITYIRISKTSTSFREHRQALLEDRGLEEDDELDSDEEIVTREFIEHPPRKETPKVEHPETLSKNIFIVHGRDHGPMGELKVLLREFGLNPIVLHEQPSGSRTIVEKLEKYSDVGYAFVVLTPDDIRVTSDKEEEEYAHSISAKMTNCTIRVFKAREEKNMREVREISEEFIRHAVDLQGHIDNLLGSFKSRARQNVVLEFGYFIGKLSRDRVCCLHKGEVELPSDMLGIVYIPFKDSIGEVRLKIMKELKEAGYEIKI